MARTSLAAFAAACAATASAFRTDTFNAREFELVAERADAAAPMRFTAALPQRNVAQLESTLLDISNPKSPRYTNWLSRDEVVSMIAPEPAVRARVTSWLAARGAVCEDLPTALSCEAPASAVESIFKTRVSTYRQHRAGRADRVLHRVAPEESFSLPAELNGELLLVTQLYDFPTERMRQGQIRPVGKPASAATDLTVVIESLQAIYKTNGVTGGAASITAPAEFQSDSAVDPKDIKAFSTKMAVPEWTIAKKVGPYGGSDTEATLDEEYMAGVGIGNTQWYWTEATGVGWMLEWTQQLLKLNSTELPGVFSVSWGWSEQDQCTIDPKKPECKKPNTSQTYVTAVNAQFAAVTAMGVSILVASGDSGAHGRNDGGCALKKTQPDWPAASPWITSVGATQLAAGGTPLATPKSPYCVKPDQGACAGGGTEVVCSTGTPVTPALIVSGGGFSVYAPAGSYQSAAVSAYLASGALLPPDGDFNKTNRAYPDVAALGHNVLIYEGGAQIVDGTSCSAPIFGGVLGLANAARLAAGKKVLGFANPAIYQVGASTPGAFTDVVTGDNTCTEDGCVAGCTGFGATKGWDATSGWGSPNVPVLVAALAAL